LITIIRENFGKKSESGTRPLASNE